jgi:hypothetical protein
MSKIDHEKYFPIKSYIALSFVYLLIILLGHEDIAWYIKPFDSISNLGNSFP